MKKLLIAGAAAALLLGVAGGAIAQAQDEPGSHHGHGPDGRHGGPGAMLMEADANHDGVITRAEFDAQRTAMFARLDTDSNGQISRDEMRAGRARHHGEGAPDGAGFISRLDSNHDGRVTREEFLARPNAEFDRLDANHDGALVAGEAPHRPPGGPHAERRHGERRHGEERRHWRNPDTNGDHNISSAEFAAEGDAMFTHLDANGDGRITQEELEAARPPHGPPEGGPGNDGGPPPPR